MMREEFKMLKGKDNFFKTLTDKLEYENIHLMDQKETKKLFQKRAKIYQRG